MLPAETPKLPKWPFLLFDALLLGTAWLIASQNRNPFTGQPRYHAGVDLDAPLGSVVYAAASGVVVYAGLQGGYGRYVVVDHGDGLGNEAQARIGQANDGTDGHGSLGIAPVR